MVPRSASPRSSRPFLLPPGLKLLSTEQLDTLGQAIHGWHERARGASQAAARGRLVLVYLMLRHTGASLGEVLALDDRTSFDLPASAVTLRGSRGGAPRTIPLPQNVAGQLGRLLADRSYDGQRGTLFHLDPGYVRRQLYALAKECGIPKDCAGPRVIRVSRAVEQLRGGVPMPVVQAQLGLATATTTAALVRYDEPDIARICRAFLRQESRAKTSARNVFPAVIEALRPGPVLTEVRATTQGGLSITTIVTNHSVEHMGLEPGLPVEASVKAPLVMIAAGAARPRCSADNAWPGKVGSVRMDACVAEVVLILDGGEEVCAVVGATAWEAVALREGNRGWALIDASAVVLTVE